MSATSAEAGGTSVIVMSSLAFVANATDGTVTTFSLDDDAVLRDREIGLERRHAEVERLASRVIMLEKGRNHLLSLDAPYGPLGHVSNDEVKFTRRYFLGPDPLLEPRTRSLSYMIMSAIPGWR